MIRRLRKIILVLLAIGTAVLVGGLVYLAYLGGIERLANNRISSMFAEQNNLDIRIGEIGGDMFTSLSLHDVEIYYVDPQHRYLMARIPELRTAYSFSNLWNRRYILSFLYIDSLDITLVRDTSSGWLLPPLTRSDAPQKEPTALPSFLVSKVTINQGDLTIIRDGDTTAFHNISFAAAIEGDQGMYAAELDRVAFTSELPGVSLDAGEGKVTYSERNLLFRDVSLISGPTRLSLEGNVGFGERPIGTVRLNGDNVDVTRIADYLNVNLPGLVDLSGQVSFAGLTFEGSLNVAGNLSIFNMQNLVVGFRYGEKFLYLDSVYGSLLDGCSIDGRGEIDFGASPDAYRLDADIRNFNLNNLVAGTFESDLTGHMVLKGESFSNKDLKLTVDADLYESRFDDFPIQQASGRMLITPDSLVFADSFRVDYYENVFWVGGTIDYDDDIDLAVQIDLNNLDRYRNTRLFIKEPGGRGYAEATLTGHTEDPDLNGWFASDSVWIYGLYADTFYTDIHLNRFLAGRKGTVEIWFDSGAAWGLSYDTGYASLIIDSNLVYTDSTLLRNPYVTVTGTSVLDYYAQPQQLRIDEVHIDLLGRDFHNPEDLLIQIDTAGFIFSRAEIGSADARASLEGRINYDESMNFSLAVQRLPVAPWLNLIDSTLPVDGYLSTSARVAGTFMAPEIELSGNVDSLTYRDLILGKGVASMSYSDARLEIDSACIYSDSGAYRARGALYTNLAFTADSTERFPRRPMSIRIEAHDSEFDLVSLVLPSVEELRGNFLADCELYGNPHEPHIFGEAYVKKARLKYFDLENYIFADSAGVTMHDDSIIIDRIEAYATERNDTAGIGTRHYAYIRGSLGLITLDSLFYDVEVRLENEFPFVYELDDIRGKAEGRLFVEGPTPPTVSGDIQLISAQYRVPFAEEGTGSPILRALTTENTWDLNLNIEILSNYWVKNEDIDAEFAGDINLIRQDGDYRFLGEMEILRGRGFLFDKTFRLEPGSRVIFQGRDTLNPQLDITGYTRISAVRGGINEEGPATEQVDLCIHVGGTLERPEINPCGGADFTQSDILPLIVANYYGGGDLAVGGQIEERLFGLGYANLSQIGSRQLNQIGIGVETFEIDPVRGEELGPWNAWVTIGKYIGEGLYVYGRTTIAGQTRQEAGFEYRLSRGILFEGRHDEDGLHHLNLRLHWEW